MRGTYDVIPTADMVPHVFTLHDGSPLVAYAIPDKKGVWRKVFIYDHRMVVRVNRAAWDGPDFLVLRDVEENRTFEAATKDFHNLAEVALCRD